MTNLLVGISVNTYKNWVDEYVNATNLAGVEYLLIDFCRSDWMEIALKCNIIIWRVHLNDYQTLADARIKIPLLELKGVYCFPNSRAVFDYDNKVIQYYRMLELGMPQPQTIVSSSLEEIENLAPSLKYPLVEKKPHGAGSVGVRLIESPKTGLRSARRMLDQKDGTINLFHRVINYIVRAALPNLCNRYTTLLWQEFLRSEFDIRCAVYGNGFISVFKRNNRPNDFRASGSGIWETMELNEVKRVYDFIKKHHYKLNVPFNAYDLICRGDDYVVLEYSYAVMLSSVYVDNLYVVVNDTISKAAAKPFGVVQLESLVDHYITVNLKTS